MTDGTINQAVLPAEAASEGPTPPPQFSLLRLDFYDLYARHLRRHSQFGVNAAHLAALFGLWYGIYGILYWVSGTPWVPIALAGAYLLSLTPNLPLKVLAATAAFLGLFLAALLCMPARGLPIWLYLALPPIFYWLQNYSHKVFHVEKDMTEYNRKYPKGRTLFVVLLFYEVPTLLNYLVFDRKHWSA